MASNGLVDRGLQSRSVASVRHFSAGSADGAMPGEAVKRRPKPPTDNARADCRPDNQHAHAYIIYKVWPCQCPIAQNNELAIVRANSTGTALPNWRMASVHDPVIG